MATADANGKCMCRAEGRLGMRRAVRMGPAGDPARTLLCLGASQSPSVLSLVMPGFEQRIRT